MNRKILAFKNREGYVDELERLERMGFHEESYREKGNLIIAGFVKKSQPFFPGDFWSSY
jgi:hypothetical protein